MSQSTRDFSPAGDVGLKPNVLRGKAKSVALADVLQELDELETPSGVDPSVFAQLKSALALQLTTNNQQLTTAKFVSKPPTGIANRVTDLALIDNLVGTFTLT